MSTETVPEVQRCLRRAIDFMRLQCDDILALQSTMTYADRVAMRDDASYTTGWRRHWYRVLKQHHEAGWDIKAAWADWQEYDRVLNTWIAMMSEHLGMTVPDRQDPKPKVERILKPGEMTNSQKAGWAASAGLFVVVTGFAILLSSTDTASYSSQGGNGFGLPIGLAYLFWFAMTCWWCWAGKYEKTHPNFGKARVAVGMVGVGIMAKKAYDAHQGVQERLR